MVQKPNPQQNMTSSPINQNSLTPFLECIDYAVSRETFSLLKDEDSGMLVTSPMPEADELSKYYESEDYISHTDSNKSFTDKLYQKVKKISLKKKLKLINKYNLKEKTLLDIGCGTGDFLLTCATNNWKVCGIEPNEKANKLVNEKFNSTSKKIQIYTDIDILIEENGSINLQFEVITLWHVLEHVPDPVAYISKLKRLLSPTGTLIVAVPNHHSYDAQYYKQYWAGYDVPRHLWHFSQKAIHELFAKEEMEVIKTIPMKFDSFYVSMLSEKYKNQKGNLIKAFYVGLLSNIKAIKSGEYSSLIYIIKSCKRA